MKPSDTIGEIAKRKGGQVVDYVNAILEWLDAHAGGATVSERERVPSAVEPTVEEWEALEKLVRLTPFSNPSHGALLKLSVACSTVEEMEEKLAELNGLLVCAQEGCSRREDECEKLAGRLDEMEEKLAAAQTERDEAQRELEHERHDRLGLREWKLSHDLAKADLERAESAQREAEQRAEKAEARVAAAVEALEETRWNPDGEIAEWAKTPDGQNHARVMRALEVLREAKP